MGHVNLAICVSCDQAGDKSSHGPMATEIHDKVNYIHGIGGFASLCFFVNDDVYFWYSGEDLAYFHITQVLPVNFPLSLFLF